ncbi:hypothetical protein CY34DRAFT_507020 [Suillus luteus UH-Slu-Lm8-n1]|uniref:Cerato-platanin n=1 Tax=Suillus luteus UH-Slu-Lm8-n1 TaxID=930992 RepID=A0A0D0A655_9AGAM|nr:hypothetical protein CY34DRAFT_507020 [Suillus luteus UH-Slu-Lm8-n1]
MKFTLVVALLSALALPALAVPAYVTFDPVYNNPDGSLNSVSCSDGKNGLLAKGYTTFSSIPSFPNIGGVPGATWNSTLCGTCWSLQYTTPSGVQTTIFITAIDAAYTFNISPKAFNTLNNGTGFEIGKIAANVTQVAAINCGM